MSTTTTSQWHSENAKLHSTIHVPCGSPSVCGASNDLKSQEHIGALNPDSHVSIGLQHNALITMQQQQAWQNYLMLQQAGGTGRHLPFATTAMQMIQPGPRPQFVVQPQFLNHSGALQPPLLLQKLPQRLSAAVGCSPQGLVMQPGYPVPRPPYIVFPTATFGGGQAFMHAAPQPPAGFVQGSNAQTPMMQPPGLPAMPFGGLRMVAAPPQSIPRGTMPTGTLMIVTPDGQPPLLVGTPPNGSTPVAQEQVVQNPAATPVSSNFAKKSLQKEPSKGTGSDRDEFVAKRKKRRAKIHSSNRPLPSATAEISNVAKKSIQNKPSEVTGSDRDEFVAMRKKRKAKIHSSNRLLPSATAESSNVTKKMLQNKPSEVTGSDRDEFVAMRKKRKAKMHSSNRPLPSATAEISNVTKKLLQNKPSEVTGSDRDELDVIAKRRAKIHSSNRPSDDKNDFVIEERPEPRLKELESDHPPAKHSVHSTIPDLQQHQSSNSSETRHERQKRKRDRQMKHDRSKRGPFRKRLCKISFNELSTRTSKLWRVLPTDKKQFYLESARLNAERYKSELASD